MKTLSLAVMLGCWLVLPALAQDKSTNAPTPPIQGNAVGQGTQVQPPPNRAQTIVVLRERPYYGGALTDAARGSLLKPAPQAFPRSPVQNPAIDLSTQRPRGIVLFSWNF